MKPRINVDDFFDEDLKSARRRAEKVIAEDGIFDSKDMKLGKPFPTPNEEFDEEVFMFLKLSLIWHREKIVYCSHSFCIECVRKSAA